MLGGQHLPLSERGGRAVLSYDKRLSGLVVNPLEPVDLQEDCGFSCSTFGLATVGGSGGSSWSSNAFFVGAEGEGKQSLILQPGGLLRCAQSLLMAAHHPWAT